MAVLDQIPIAIHTANGSTSTFSYQFFVPEAADLKVRTISPTGTNTLLADGVGYTPSGVGNPTGGSVALASSPAAGTVVMVYRETQLIRKVTWLASDDLPKAVLEADFDRPWRALQEILNGGRAATRIQVFDSLGNMVVDEGPVVGAASLAGGNQYVGAQAVGFATLVDAPTIAVDASLSNHYRVTLGGNRILANPTKLRDGVILNFWIKQDGTGSRTLTLGSKYKHAGGIAPVLTTTAGALDLLAYQYNQALDVLGFLGIQQDVR